MAIGSVPSAGSAADGSTPITDIRTADWSADAPPSGVAARWGRVAGVPVAIFAATRIAQIAVLAWVSPPGTSLRDRLLSWDAGWFIRIATDGYPHGYTYDSAGHLLANGLAFFPLYPGLMRGGMLLGLSAGASALIITTAAGAIAAVLVAELARHLFAAHGEVIARRAGYALVVLVCAQPMSIVESMGYSESIFLAAVAGMFLAAYRRHWLVAGLLGAAAGLTRPTGAAAGVALAVAAVICLADPARSIRERVSAAVGAVVGLAGVPAYIGWVGLRVGDMSAWFKIQTAGWGTTFDYGRSTFTFIRDTLRAADGWVAVSVALLLIAATIAVVVAARANPWPPLTIYGILAFVLVVGQTGYYHSKPRLLLPVLLLFFPAALAAGRTRPRMAALWLTVYAAFGFWYGAYMLAVWHYAI